MVSNEGTVEKADSYRVVQQRLDALLDQEHDEIAVMSTIVCELFHGFARMDWVGFYRVVSPGLLKVGPYQGGHGCLTISFERGVCGRCAREKSAQLVRDVSALPYHIACSSSTRSEIVVPVFDDQRRVRAVLDIDSNTLAAFDSVDQEALERVCDRLVACYRVDSNQPEQ